MCVYLALFIISVLTTVVNTKIPCPGPDQKIYDGCNCGDQISSETLSNGTTIDIEYVGVSCTEMDASFTAALESMAPYVISNRLDILEIYNSNITTLVPKSKPTFSFNYIYIGDNPNLVYIDGAFFDDTVTLELENMPNLTASQSVAQMVSNFSSLQSLTLTNLQLTSVPKFQYNSNVTGLWLSNNLISSIPSKAFSAFPNLQLLELSSNRLSSSAGMASDAFHELSKLETLQMNNNNDVQYLNETIFAPLSKYVKIFADSDSCDARSSWMCEDQYLTSGLHYSTSFCTGTVNGVLWYCPSLESK